MRNKIHRLFFSNRKRYDNIFHIITLLALSNNKEKMIAYCMKEDDRRMKQFAVVLQELRKWFESFKWYQRIWPYALHFLFGGLGYWILCNLIISLFSDINYKFKVYKVMDFIMYTIPTYAISNQIFLLGIWLTLISKQVRYLPYALWLKAAFILFPFTSMSLTLVIPGAVYAYLGYLLYRFTKSGYVEQAGRAQ